MNREGNPITIKKVVELSTRSADIVRDHNQYLRINIETHMMLVITDLAGVINAEKSQVFHGAKSVPMELANASLGIFSLLGIIAHLKPFPDISEEEFQYEYEQGLIQTQCSIPLSLYKVVTKIITNDLGHQPLWYVAECMQGVIAMIFAIADNHGINLLDTIETKLDDYASKSE